MEPFIHPNPIDGALPFVGREPERRRLTAFWERTRRADGMYLGLLTGEAGVGKSRLLREVLPAVEEAGGAVVHARLYPHASARIGELVNAAVATAEARCRLKAGRAGAAVERLRRLCRLRRTLLVVEDLHLLGDEEMAELDALIRSLADDPIGILCVARSGEPRGLGSLEEHLVETLPLVGLDAGELAELWRRLFGAMPDAGTVEVLRETTRGNCLAVRSTLRAAVESGALVADDRGVVAGPAFAAVARRKSGRIATGLMMHLSAAEREAAHALARLGEVFSREAALAMIPDAAALLPRLVEGQIIATLDQPALPLPGTPDWSRPYDAECDDARPASAFPLLTFTHSLIHRELLEEGTISWRRLAGVLALDCPIYSLVPLRSLPEMAAEADPSDLQRIVYRACSVAVELNRGAAWRSGLELADAAAEVLSRHADRWPELERVELEAGVLYARVLLRRRSFTSDEYRTLADRLDLLTRDAPTATLASYRFCLHACRSWESPVADEIRRTRIEAEMLLERFPELANGREYLTSLKQVTLDSTIIGPERARRVEELLNEFAARPGVKERYRADIYHVRTVLLHTYATSAELALRMRQLEELDQESNGEDDSLAVARCKLVGFNGWMERMIDAAGGVIRRLTRSGATGFPVLNFRTMQVIGRTGLERSRERIEEEIERLRAEFEGDEDRTPPMIVMTIVAIGMLRGEPEWIVRRIAGLGGPGRKGIGPLQSVQLHILMLDGEAVRRDLEMYPDIVPPMIRNMAGAMLAAIEGSPDAEELVCRIAAFVDREIMKVSDLVYLHALFAFIERCRRGDPDRELGGVVERLGDLPARALRIWLPWLAERALFALIDLLAARYGEYLSAEEAGCWRERAAALEGEWLARRGMLPEAPVELSMLDSVTFRKPGRESDRQPEPVRGARMRVLVGLMVADRMIRAPLSPADVHALIAGEEEAVEHPRKVMNLTVFRLRELLGAEAILTDGRTPRLNLERVRVDLLEADSLISGAATYLRDRDLARALPAVVEALEIVGGRTPFPSLYDRFFEAMREDFESRLRSVAIGVAELTLEVGDAAGAERVLGLAAAAMPGDEEVTEMLARALVMLDRRAEAELLARRSAEADDGIEAVRGRG